MPSKSTKKTAKTETTKSSAKVTVTKKKATTPKAASSTKKPTKAKPSTKSKPRAAAKTAEVKTDTSAPSKETSALDYDALLHRAREQIPPEVFDQPRFQVPRVDSFIQGARTIIRNFKDLTDTLRRDPKHLIRFLAHELATAGEVSGTQAVFNGRFTSRVLEDLVNKYTDEFVVCPICHRPDTEIRREDRLVVLVCTACGGRKPLKG